MIMKSLYGILPGTMWMWPSTNNALHDDAAPRAEELEQRLAATFGELSFNERHTALEEVHGVKIEFDEPSGDELDRILAELEDVLNRLMIESSVSSHAYSRARATAPEFTNSRDLRIRILRAELFEVKKAAERMLQYFSWKLMLFGEEKLGREIRLKDLPPGSLKILQSGVIRFLPHRDQSGRLILFATKDLLKEDIPTRDRQSLIWYHLELAARDEITQKNGIVRLWWMIDHPYEYVPEQRKRTATFVQVVKAAPIRFSAVHWCLNESAGAHILRFGALLLEKSLRARIKFHCGTTQEVLYELMSVGIPKAIVPVDHNGEVQIVGINEFIETTIRQEETIENASGGDNSKIVPKPIDVMLGRGADIAYSLGNSRLRQLVPKHFDRYDASSRYERVILSHTLLRVMQKDGCRFLREDSNGVWETVSDEVAVEKIAHSFRNLKAKEQRHRNTRRSISMITPIEEVTSSMGAASVTRPGGCFF